MDIPVDHTLPGSSVHDNTDILAGIRTFKRDQEIESLYDTSGNIIIPFLVEILPDHTAYIYFNIPAEGTEQPRIVRNIFGKNGFHHIGFIIDEIDLIDTAFFMNSSIRIGHGPAPDRLIAVEFKRNALIEVHINVQTDDGRQQIYEKENLADTDDVIGQSYFIL